MVDGSVNIIKAKDVSELATVNLWCNLSNSKPSL